MSEPLVAISRVADGSMHNRKDPLDPAVITNRRQWLKSQGIDSRDATRVRVTFTDGDNYCRYREVTEEDKGEGMTNADIQPADALVTTTAGHALFLPVADCVATTIFDEEHGVLMLSHLGRQSLEQQGGLKSIKYLEEVYGSKVEHLKIWLSPTVSKEVYKIYKLDDMGMKEALYEQLQEAGIDFGNVVDNAEDTDSNHDFFSYSEYLKGNRQEDGCFAMVAMIVKD